MKKIILTISFLYLGSINCLKDVVYLKSALQDGKLDLAASIATNFNLDDLIAQNSDLEDIIESKYNNDINNFKKAVAAKKAGGGTGMNKEQVQQMLKEAQVNVPEITSKVDAKNKLANFFDASQVGGKLLTEIGANPQQADAVKNAISAIKPAA